MAHYLIVQQIQQSGRWEFSHARSASTQMCLGRLKNETGPWTARHSIFLLFHRRGYPKRKKANFVTLYDWTLSSTPTSTPCLQCGLNKWQRNYCKEMRETQRAQVAVSEQRKEHALAGKWSIRRILQTTQSEFFLFATNTSLCKRK